jgi:hypothetical protein
MISCPTPPRSHNGIVEDVETGSEFFKQHTRQPFGEDISELGRCRNVKDTNLAEADALTDEMQVDLDMLCALMLDRVA